MVDVSKIVDADKILAALTVVEKTRQYPLLKGLHDIAMAVLMEQNNSALAELGRRAMEAAAAEAKAQAEVDATIKAQAAKEAAANALHHPVKPIAVSPAQAPGVSNAKGHS